MAEPLQEVVRSFFNLYRGTKKCPRCEQQVGGFPCPECGYKKKADKEEEKSQDVPQNLEEQTDGELEEVKKKPTKLQKIAPLLAGAVLQGVAGAVAGSSEDEEEVTKGKKGTSEIWTTSGDLKQRKHLDEFEYGYEEGDEKVEKACWSTHRQDGWKKLGNRTVPNCVKKTEQENKKPLNKPMRDDGDKKFKVYVRDPKTGNIVTVRFGDPNMEIKRDDPERRRSFRARHDCDNAKDITTPQYWSCKMWEKETSVTEYTNKDFNKELKRQNEVARDNYKKLKERWTGKMPSDYDADKILFENEYGKNTAKLASLSEKLKRQGESIGMTTGKLGSPSTISTTKLTRERPSSAVDVKANNNLTTDKILSSHPKGSLPGRSKKVTGGKNFSATPSYNPKQPKNALTNNNQTSFTTSTSTQKIPKRRVGTNPKGVYPKITMKQPNRSRLRGVANLFRRRI